MIDSVLISAIGSYSNTNMQAVYKVITGGIGDIEKTWCSYSKVNLWKTDIEKAMTLYGIIKICAVSLSRTIPPIVLLLIEMVCVGVALLKK